MDYAYQLGRQSPVVDYILKNFSKEEIPGLFSTLEQKFLGHPEFEYVLKLKEGFSQSTLEYENPQIKMVTQPGLSDDPLRIAYQNIAQGSNIAPILTAVGLKDFMEQLPSVFYADDGIFFSDKPIKILDDPDKGIFLNEDKSSLIKERGQ